MANGSEAPPPQAVLMNMVTGVWAAQAAATLARLGVPDELAKGAKSAAELAPVVGADAGALHRLMRACVTTGLLTSDAGGRFALTPVGEFLRADVFGSLRSFLIAELAPGHWLPWGHLEHCVRTGQPAAERALGMSVWEYYKQNPEEGAHFSGAMSGVSAAAIHAVLAAYSFAGARRVVDVGGAHGALLAPVLQSEPNARGVLFDLPEVVGGASGMLASFGVADRVECVAGSFFDNVPEGGDVYLLKHILHDWNDDECTRILRNIRKAMAPDGRVVVIEMPIVTGGPPSPAALLDLNMMVLLTGKERTPEEYAALFTAAGLRLAGVTPTQSPFAVIEARPA